MLSILRNQAFCACMKYPRAAQPLLRSAGKADVSFINSDCHCIFTSSTILRARKKDHSNTKSSDGISDKLQTAATRVAEAMPGDRAKTESDLLHQLRLHSSHLGRPTADKPPSVASSSIFEGIRVVKKQTREKTEEVIPSERSRPNEEDGGGKQTKEDKLFSRPDFKFFEGPALNIFPGPGETEKSVEPPKAVARPKPNLWEVVQQEELDRVTAIPTSNAWEEMIQWTREGKMWTFPINNEAGMEEEANVSFYDHVFLEDLLTKFPAQGPVRYFMELVVIGLSKNPYLTVREKRDHIDWYYQYFSEKEKVLQEALGEHGVLPRGLENKEDKALPIGDL